MPPRSLILKLTSFCNIDCDYCYMFNLADRSFEHQPLRMHADTAIAAVRQYAGSLEAAGNPAGAVVFHGGEPTLWPLASFERLLGEIDKLRQRGCRLECGLQTNLVKPLGPGLVKLLVEAGVRIGVSLDGPADLNDRHRVDHAGRGTYDRVLRNVRALVDGGHAELLTGFLCVMQPDIPPAAFLNWIESLPVRSVDLLWPMDATVAQPPWRGTTQAEHRRAPRLGTWLVDLFDAWLARDDLRLRISLFEDVVRSRLGETRGNDMLGRRAFRSLVVNTDGSFALPDYLRASASTGSGLGCSVHQGGLEQALRHPGRLRELEAMHRYPAECAECPHVAFCAGGTLSGRVTQLGKILDRPSVLCADHKTLYDAVDARLAAFVSARAPAPAHAIAG